MKNFWSLVLIGLIAYGVYYLYEVGYFNSVVESFEDTKENVSDFVTDKAIKEVEFN